MRQIVLDTETTGLSTAQGHRIIEIGCVELVNRRLSGRDWHRFLNPDREIDEGAERVHGISRADLETAPRFPEVVDEFLDFIRDAELVIHNAEFDIGFLEHELQLMSHPQPAITDHARVLDTLALARKIHPGQRNSLDALCKRYEIDASKRDVHGALIDSELLAHVYLAMTGGQTALSLDEDAGAAAAATSGPHSSGIAAQEHRAGSGAAVAAEAGSYLVIRADADEAAAHEAMLDKLREAGHCVWDRH
ncbi:MAG: DNA polymerase III subunit epsilon [Woeseiaceae bacterium]|nr:DNA polymerase III subunit epsilon [Woeseiaceae bacterium]